MDAQDVAPSRLTRAKHKILDILQVRQEGQTALVIFAGESFIVSPLTDDAQTMKALVQSLETNLMPVQGSRPDLALHRGQDLLEQAGIPGGDLLLITDGDADPAMLETIKHVVSKGRRVFILGVGTEDGAPIPEEGGFVKDASGAIVVAKVGPASLQRAAKAGGGRFAMVMLDDGDLDHVLPSVDVLKNVATTVQTQRTTDVWREEGPWLVLVLLAVVLPAFRRGWLGVMLAFMFVPQISQAFSWEDVWARPDQQAIKALEQNNPKEAAGLFEQTDWKGIAHYRAGDYEQAEQDFSGIDSSEARYNRGNALAKLGKYQEAIASYQAAITQQPGHEDAKHNLDVLKKMLEDQQSQSSQDKDSESSGDNQQAGDQGSQDKQSQRQGTEKNDQDETSEQSSAKQDSNDKEAGDSSQRKQSQLEQMEPSDAVQPSSSDDEKEADLQKQMASAPQPEGMDDDKKSEQALQQWLRRIPDDPGGLLRRKILLEHRRRLEAGTAVDASGRPW
jgi:Ca-activated chloride channel family protein